MDKDIIAAKLRSIIEAANSALRHLNSSDDALRHYCGTIEAEFAFIVDELTAED